MVYFFRRGTNALVCETRLNPNGEGYQLAITEDGAVHLESFETVAAMLSREHSLLQAWRALGWHDLGLRSPDRETKPKG